jgi:TPR repeat protein
LDIAERYLNGIGRSRNSAVAAQFLWAAVAKGNATAELTLAHLYLNGDGVGRSCEQARLLLQAAASKGDLEADDTLANLSRERCR